jgi:transposase
MWRQLVAISAISRVTFYKWERRFKAEGTDVFKVGITRTPPTPAH